MRINLKLWHQGLVLVGVPISLMLIFVLSLTFLLGQAELKAQEVDRSKTIISKANALLKDYFDAGSQLLFFKYTKSENTRLRFDQHLSHSGNAGVAHDINDRKGVEQLKQEFLAVKFY